MAWTCPNCGHHIAADVPLPVHCICRHNNTIPVIERQQKHWEALHRFPFSDDWGCQTRCQWFAAWQASIPNINCNCRKHWNELVEAMPPDFSSREAFFAWTVEAHNAVNQRLGKALVTLEEARRLHQLADQGAQMAR